MKPLVWSVMVASLLTSIGAQEKSNSERNIAIRIASKDVLDQPLQPKVSGHNCVARRVGSRIKGKTASGIELTMSCEVLRGISCNEPNDPYPLAPVDESSKEDGKKLSCGDEFHVGQTVTFESDGSGGYRVVQYSGFDGTFIVADRKHLKSWQVESEKKLLGRSW
jgi:hypothetical protein